MKRITTRTLTFAVLGVSAAALAGGFWLRDPGPPTARTVVLTAVMAQGIWTDEPVTAANAWRRDFRAARPVLRAGETVRLRLESADVVHSFAVPDLGIDPIEVHPGKPSWLTLTPGKLGTYTYYCTVVCGERHFAMQGVLEVTGDRSPAVEQPAAARPYEYWLVSPPAPDAERIERGRALFQRSGCVTCHGEEGRGGIRNPNSMNATVPELRTLARRTFLFSPSDVARFRAVLEGTHPLETAAAPEGLPLFATVRRQYLDTRQLIREGRRSTKLDPAGPRPPLDMPAWGVRLDDADIDAILTYLLTLEGAATRTARSSDALPARVAEGEVR